MLCARGRACATRLLQDESQDSEILPEVDGWRRQIALALRWFHGLFWLVGADLGQPLSTKERAQLHGAIVPDGVAGGTVFGVADAAGVDEGD